MPELPEAETIVRGLRPHLIGRRIRGVQVIHQDVLREPERDFAERVRGTAIGGVERRGKNVLLTLGDRGVVAINLGMTGRLLPRSEDTRIHEPAGHPAVVFELAPEGVLVFDDTRRFGTVEHLSPEAWRARSRRMGPEPLARSFSAARLHRALSGSRAPVRSWLLDQRRIAGIGNIYANEALYLSGIHPMRHARDVTRTEAGRLHRALRRVLRGAIQARGTTIRDYRTAEGTDGGFAVALRVYGREGKPCRRCSSPVERIVFGNRSAFLCPTCQPRTPKNARG